MWHEKNALFKLGFTVLLLLSFANCSLQESTQTNFIENTFEGKIVYQQSAELEAVKKDCKEKGGTFSECGSPCAPDAEMCIEVCAYTCLLTSEKMLEENPIQKPEEKEELIKESFSGKDLTGLGLEVPDNFSLEIFAENLSGARNIVGPDALGNYWISRSKEGVITLLEVIDHQVQSQSDVLRDLNYPHGLALDTDGLTLFIAEEDKVSKIQLYSDTSQEDLVKLPTGGRHTSRSLLLGPDDRLYISIGSACDTCYEEDERRGTVYVMNKDGTDFQPFAIGLRNAVFLTTHFVTGNIWATEMGRDFLGDNLPPDEVNILQEGQDYGWPICYGKNVHDSMFDTNKYIQNPCEQKAPSKIDLQAHSAPLGLAFVPEEGWPEKLWYDLLIAYHGSWNRSSPTGYKIIRIQLDEHGKELGREDFISGWLKEDGTVVGRPVDILIQPGGILLITDDKKGVIYKLSYSQ